MTEGVQKLQASRATEKEIDLCFLKPFGARVVVLEDKFKYVGRIHIPDTAQKSPTTGVIVAIGPDVDESLLGKHVAYAMFSGTAYTFKGRPRYRVLGLEELHAEIVPRQAEDQNLELEDVIA